MSIFGLRLRLLLRDKTALICYIAAVAVILTVAAGLNVHANERSSLPVGLICEDSREPAQRLKEAVKGCESLYVYDGDETLMRRLLEDGYINCYFTIGSDYSGRVEAGDIGGLIDVCAPEDDNISIVAADIIAGYMMDEICTDKAYLRYTSLKRNTGAGFMSFDEYKAYVNAMSEDEMFAFNFDVVYSDNQTGSIDARDITNGMIYRQIIAGMVAMLVMLAAFCSFNGVVSDREHNITERKRAMGVLGVKSEIQEAAAVFVYLIPLGALATCVFVKETAPGQLPLLFALNMLLTAFCVLISCICALVSHSVASYQLVGTVVILTLGVTGFVSVFEGVMGIHIFEYSPIAFYIGEFIELVQGITL